MTNGVDHSQSISRPRATWSDLPEDPLLIIFGKLTEQDWKIAMRVNRSWKQLIEKVWLTRPLQIAFGREVVTAAVSPPFNFLLKLEKNRSNHQLALVCELQKRQGFRIVSKTIPLKLHGTTITSRNVLFHCNLSPSEFIVVLLGRTSSKYTINYDTLSITEALLPNWTGMGNAVTEHRQEGSLIYLTVPGTTRYDLFVYELNSADQNPFKEKYHVTWMNNQITLSQGDDNIILLRDIPYTHNTYIPHETYQTLVHGDWLVVKPKGEYLIHFIHLLSDNKYIYNPPKDRNLNYSPCYQGLSVFIKGNLCIFQAKDNEDHDRFFPVSVLLLNEKRSIPLSTSVRSALGRIFEIRDIHLDRSKLTMKIDAMRVGWVSNSYVQVVTRETPPDSKYKTLFKWVILPAIILYGCYHWSPKILSWIKK